MDYDLSMFSSYVGNLKFLMKSVFQSVMYRMYRVQRSDISQFPHALKMQAFNRDSNCIFGYVFKTLAIKSHQGVNA